MNIIQAINSINSIENTNKLQIILTFINTKNYVILDKIETYTNKNISANETIYIINLIYLK
jgi:hypothetical protein